MMLVSRNGRGIVQRVVVVRFRGVVDHDVGLGHQRVDQRGVADVALHEA